MENANIKPRTPKFRHNQTDTESITGNLPPPQPMYIDGIKNTDDSNTLIDMYNTIKKFPQLLKLIYQIIKLYKGIKNMNNIDIITNKYAWLATVIVVLNTILGFFNLGLDAATLDMVQSGITSLVVAIIGVIAYYTGKTPKTVNKNTIPKV